MTYPNKPISLTASATLKREQHSFRKLILNAAAGLTVTLPAAVGSGDRYEIFVGTTVTSNALAIKAASSSDIIQGVIGVSTDAAGVNVPTAADSDTISMNGSTTGGLKGSRIILQDVSTGVWEVSGALVSTGAEATPFSATV
jgi:hypothetical protein